MRKIITAVLDRREIRLVLRLIRQYNMHDAAQQGAALAYYLLFSLFPILILISSLIGQLRLDLSAVLEPIAPILPEGVMALTDAYLSYVSEHVSVSMLCFSAVFSVWFPMRATGCLMRAVRRAYDLGIPKSRIRAAFKVLFFTVLLLVSLMLTLLLMTAGNRFMSALGRLLFLPEWFTGLWGILRFTALGTVSFAALSVLYALAQDQHRPLRMILPGSAAATLAWIILSFGYSLYVEYISNYSVIYGALGAVMVLLIWLYLTALTLIAGAELNHILTEPPARRDDRFYQGGTQ